jgi:trans-2-enoyl-CoA reductase
MEETAKFNKIQKELWKNITRYDFRNFTDYSTKRQFEKLSVLGIAALDEVDSNQVIVFIHKLIKNLLYLKIKK